MNFCRFGWWPQLLMAVLLCTVASANPTDSTAPCNNGQFVCANGRCILGLFRCDDDDDCLDGSDELECILPGQNCKISEFECENRKCIRKWYVCDIDDDCGDGSDERNCNYPDVPCGEDEFRCANRRCIATGLTCDGVDDCRDGSDELNCTLRKSHFTVFCPRI
ncbi:low-density lipoprotein receptor-related protein 4-like [Hyalella azteca]|uniref:Low-density lipoprotein receptor-related protein 4-like n=1 Tax=Hyalella azteca TaxID=294128 RepID=A0A8B7NW70_HYAAZ|nr:low-density lipoprotein receptor-related protein 4-like [Hyalella azteca]